MLAKLNTFALVGIDAAPVEVEGDLSVGLPKTVRVGLPEMAVGSVHAAFQPSILGSACPTALRTSPLGSFA